MRVVERADEAAVGARVGAVRGAQGLRPRRVLRRALPHLAAPRRDADHRRHPRQLVWVGERDCSAQRRHQKLVEESPAADFPDEVRQAMGEAAVKVAKACGYYNAGTVEFLFQDGEFYFLEMNTRLQVEHPVTELVSGLDLVARADPGGLRRAAVVHAGRHRPARATPSRSASTPRTRPGASSCPSPGTITKLVPPQGFGIRWDGGYEAGDEVSQYYDNLVGKLIVLGPRPRHGHRTACCGPSREFRIEGIATTIPADIAILEHPDFAAGRALDQVGGGRASTSPASSAAAPAGARSGRRHRGRAQGPARRRRRGQRQALRRRHVGARVGHGRRRRRRHRPRRPPDRVAAAGAVPPRRPDPGP